MQQQLPKAPRRPRSDKGKKHNQDHKALVGRISAFMDRNDILYHGAKTVRVPARSGSGFNFFSTSKKGLPDILVLEPSKVNQMHGLAIEVKVGMDKMKPEQIKFFKRLRQRGWRCSPPSPPLASLPCPILPCPTCAGVWRSGTSTSSRTCCRSTSGQFFWIRGWCFFGAQMQVARM